MDNDKFQELIALCGQGDVAKVLALLKDQDVDIVQPGIRHSLTALCMAARHGHYDLCKALLEQRQANIHAFHPVQKCTPLHYACKGRNRELVQLMLDAGANVNSTNKSNNTPLMLAAQVGREEIIDLLLAHGADVSVTSHNRHTAADYARMSKHYNLCNRLLRLIEEKMAADDAARLKMNGGGDDDDDKSRSNGVAVAAAAAAAADGDKDKDVAIGGGGGGGSDNSGGGGGSAEGEIEAKQQQQKQQQQQQQQQKKKQHPVRRCPLCGEVARIRNRLDFYDECARADAILRGGGSGGGGGGGSGESFQKDNGSSGSADEGVQGSDGSGTGSGKEPSGREKQPIHDPSCVHSASLPPLEKPAKVAEGYFMPFLLSPQLQLMRAHPLGYYHRLLQSHHIKKEATESWAIVKAVQMLISRFDLCYGAGKYGLTVFDLASGKASRPRCWR